MGPHHAMAAVAMAAALQSSQASKPAAAHAAAGEVTFGKEVLKTDTKLDVVSTSVRDMIIHRLGGSGPDAISVGVETVTANFSATIVHADAKLDDVRFEFAKCPRSFLPPSTRGSPEIQLSNRTYEISWSNGKEKIVRSDGATIDDFELTGLSWYTQPLTGELPLVRVLGGKTLKKGDSVDVPSEVAVLMLSPFRQMDPGGTATLTLVGEKVFARQECAVFKIKASMPVLGAQKFQQRLEMEVAGELVVTKVHCLVVVATCEGVYTFPDGRGGGSDKKPAKESKPAKNDPPKETWSWRVTIG